MQKTMNQMLRSAKGITRSIHYEGKAKRVTFGCDESIDPRIRVYANKDNNQVVDAEKATEQQPVKRVLEETVGGDQGKEAATASTSKPTPAETASSKEGTDASNSVLGRVAEGDKCISSVPPKNEKRKAKRPRTAKAKAKEKKEPKAIKEAKAKPEMTHLEAAGGCVDCEWCGEGKN